MESEGGFVDAAGVVRVGSVVFALIQPTPGHERSFNHWYERDHYYTAGTAAPGVFSAGRFVRPTTGTHLALYFVLPGFDDARVAFATEQVGVARAEDRMFDERDHLHTWSYALSGSWRADPEGVAPALALDRRYAGVTVAMVDGGEPDLDRLLAAGGHDIDLVLVLTPIARIMPSTWDGSADVGRRVTFVAFHRDDPASGPSVFAPLGEGGEIVWNEALIPMVFGTDTHIPE